VIYIWLNLEVLPIRPADKKHPVLVQVVDPAMTEIIVGIITGLFP
jgi:hypothetical protein